MIDLRDAARAFLLPALATNVHLRKHISLQLSRSGLPMAVHRAWDNWERPNPTQLLLYRTTMFIQWLGTLICFSPRPFWDVVSRDNLFPLKERNAPAKPLHYRLRGGPTLLVFVFQSSINSRNEVAAEIKFSLIPQADYELYQLFIAVRKGNSTPTDRND